MPDYYSMFMDTTGMFIFLGAELSILFILIATAVSLLQQYIPDSKIQAFLSNSHGRGYILAALLGAITPFCSCSTIPMLRGLLKAKAGFGPTLTFLFASPLLNPIIIVLFVATFGLQVSLIYISVALLISILAGYILNKMKFEQYVIVEGEVIASSASACCSGNIPSNTSCQTTEQSQDSILECCSSTSHLQPLNELKSLHIENSTCCTTSMPDIESACCTTVLQNSCCTNPKPKMEKSCCSSDESTSCSSSSKQDTSYSCSLVNDIKELTFSEKVKLAFADAWKQFKQLFPYLLLGVFLGALVYGFVPSDFIAKYASGDSIFAVPIAAVIGIPLYVRVEALIPLSAVLVGKGMSLGAVMALIIGGGGASLTEVILLKSMFRMPMIMAFLGVILGMAIVAGYLFQFIL